MITVDEALEIALGRVVRTEAERVPLEKALGRVLAEDVFADLDMPPFTKSCVDGYACRRSDLRAPMTVVDVIAAGGAPSLAIGPGECAKIMTGAMLPEGAECVFMVEQSALHEDGRVSFTGDDTKENIVLQGGDVRLGDRLLEEGHRILPQDIAVLASFGYDSPFVAQRPRVIVFATGDELVEPSATPSTSQIRNSNSHTLMALLETTGAAAVYGGIVEDSRDALEAAVERGMQYDVMCFSGGVSMGDYDFVPEILRTRGFEIAFEKIAVQPGKPMVCAMRDGMVCFGLPGNPVSTFVTFELIVRPYLFAMMGHTYRPPRVRMPLDKAFRRESAVRELWVPVVLTDEGEVSRVEYHGSAHFHALSHADGLMRVPIGVTEMAAGEPVHVRLIRA